MVAEMKSSSFEGRRSLRQPKSIKLNDYRRPWGGASKLSLLISFISGAIFIYTLTSQWSHIKDQRGLSFISTPLREVIERFYKLTAKKWSQKLVTEEPQIPVVEEIKKTVQPPVVKPIQSSNSDKVVALYGEGYCIKKTSSTSDHHCGEDAFKVSLSPKSRSFLGVADGVGGWTLSGGDSSKVSVGLLEEIGRLIETTRLSLSEATKLAFDRMGGKKIYKQGSTTLCTAVYDHETGELNLSNIGDSGAFILRGGKIVLKTKPGTEGFNAPHQIGFDQQGRPYGSVQIFESRYTFKVQPGDILVLVTDGVLDNMFDEELLGMTMAMVGSVASGIGHKGAFEYGVLGEALKERIRTTATTLAWHSWARSQEVHWRSPFGEGALRYGISFSGGKQDDITAVVAVFAGSN